VTWLDWATAWQRALYEPPGGFYLRPEGPAGHFRTAAHAAPQDLAAALSRLARDHGCTAVVDVGCGRGELLTALAAVSDLRLHGVDVVDRPAHLPAGIGWSRGTVPDDALAGALVVAWELLDVVPAEVLERDDDDRWRRVEVETATGRERLGPAVDDPWVARWWPEADRVEVGRARDEFWAHLVARAAGHGAVATLAVDYAHTLETRPSDGSLTGFRAGRAVPPRPDGSMDLTAHVAVDSLRAAVHGYGPTELTSQAEALSALGVRRGELLDRGGLGGFHWLFQRLG
jgi:SAM-dependent MidA family methyltransferase